MRKFLHAVLSWCRQRPAVALVPLLLLLYSPCLVTGSYSPLVASAWVPQWMGNLVSSTHSLSASPLHEHLTSIDAGVGQKLARLHSLLWLIATIGAARLALRYSCDLGERNTSWVAMMTLFIYATSSTSASTVLFVEQRPILISAVFSWLSLAALAARSQSHSPKLSLLSWISLGLALYASIGGLCGATFVLAYAAFGDPRNKRARIKSAWPHLCLSLGAALWWFQRIEPGCQAQGMFGRLSHLLAQALAWIPASPAQCIETRSLVLALGVTSLVTSVIAFKWILKSASPNHVRTLRWTGAGALGSLLPLIMLPADGRYLGFAALGTSFLFSSAIRRSAQAMKTNRLFALLLAAGALRHFVLAPAHTFLYTLLLATQSSGNCLDSADQVSKTPSYAHGQRRAGRKRISCGALAPPGSPIWDLDRLS